MILFTKCQQICQCMIWDANSDIKLSNWSAKSQKLQSCNVRFNHKKLLYLVHSKLQLKMYYFYGWFESESFWYIPIHSHVINFGKNCYNKRLWIDGFISHVVENEALCSQNDRYWFLIHISFLMQWTILRQFTWELSLASLRKLYTL
jgi:hypothetical protein